MQISTINVYMFK